MFEKEAGLNTDWTLIKSQPANSSLAKETANQSPTTAGSSSLQVETIDVPDTQSLLQMIRRSLAGVMRGLSLGPCTKLWDPHYLKKMVNGDRQVVVHNSPTRNMNFQRKDFAYQTLPFSTFIDNLTSPTSHLYLRALSSTNASTTPANFEEDWPELSPDVHLPPHLSSILNEAKHSSCLRIANNITMWLHYDVMANILFQIHGIKKLVLFLPSDIKYLSFPPGSTTSDLDIWPATTTEMTSTQNTKTAYSNPDTQVLAPPNTTPYVVTLHPGDALYIPPLWSHAGLSLPHSTSPPSPPPTPNSNPNIHTNISLNMFFRSLPKTFYAAGRDVYGNRDLAAYEDGRRDIDRIVKRFTAATASGNGKDVDREVDGKLRGGILGEIPSEIKRAYLERLADELIRRAGG